jgi:hypothetical protein
MTAGLKTWILSFALVATAVWPMRSVGARLTVQQSQAPFDCKGRRWAVDELTEMVKTKIPEQRRIAMIDQCGVDFQMTEAISKRLRDAGATDSVMNSVTRQARERARLSTSNGGSKPQNSPDQELALWNSIQNKNIVNEFEEYLRRYPQGRFVATARKRAQELTEQRLHQQVEQEIRGKQWDAADRALTELLKTATETDQIKAWRRAIADGRESDRKNAEVTVMRQRIEEEIRTKQWDAADHTIAELLTTTRETDQIRAWKKAVADGHESDRKNAELAAMRQRVEQEIRTKQWDAAERTIAELLKIGPETDQIAAWKKAIAGARESDRRTAELFQQVEREIATNQWDAGERTITELLKTVPETDQIKGWKKTIAEGRESDRKPKVTTLQNGDTFDFETGITKPPNGVDIQWLVLTYTQYLIAQGETSLALASKSFDAVDELELRRLRYTLDRIDSQAKRLEKGMVIAVRTADHYVKIEVLEATTSLRIRWLLYR